MSANERVGKSRFLKIKELYAWISEEEWGEGICGGLMPDGQMMPLIGADKARIESLERYIPHLQRKAEVKLVRFHNIEVLKRLPKNLGDLN